MSAAAATTAILPLLQSTSQHHDALQQALDLHEAELQQRQQHHEKEIILEQKLSAEEIRLMKELHSAQMKLTIQLAAREAIRDVLQHRNQVLQTIMIVDTVSIGCVFAMIYQFTPPLASPTVSLAVYAALLCLAVLFLVVSTFLCLTLQSRTVKYDIHRPLLVYRCGKNHPNFSSYYTCHCQRLEWWALKVYYLGAGSAAGSATTLMYVIFYYSSMHSLGPAVAYACTCGVGLVAVFAIDFFYNTRTHDMGESDTVGIDSST